MSMDLDDNTIICFTSDNGGSHPAMPMQLPTFPRGGKGRQWEGGIREPFLSKSAWSYKARF